MSSKSPVSSPTGSSSLTTFSCHSSSTSSFYSAYECVPEPYDYRPIVSLQSLDHTLGVIWCCFDEFRGPQQFPALSPAGIEWALECVQSLQELPYGQCPIEASHETQTEATIPEVESHRYTETFSDASEEMLPTCLVHELLSLYALLAKYREQLRLRQLDPIDTGHLLAAIEDLLHELSSSSRNTEDTGACALHSTTID
uniref:Uncharacterized protein n=1 Tax=Anopheles albimanus TaxID=7167 RepID=A0A182FGL2_ANOAL